MAQNSTKPVVLTIAGIDPAGAAGILSDLKTFAKEVAAWERARKESKARVDWQFATDDARIKLKHLYPRLQP